MKKSISYLLGAAALGALLFTAAPPSTAAEVVVGVAPPALRAEVITPSPGAGFGWRPGYWRWNGHAHVWVGGVWLRTPHAGAAWEAGHWDTRPSGWVWVGGHWR